MSSIDKTHIPVIRCGDSPSSWNSVLSAAFADVDAAILQNERAFPLDTAIDNLVAIHRNSPDAVLGGRIIDTKHHELCHQGTPCWSDSDMRWYRENYIEVIAATDATQLSETHAASARAVLIPKSAWIKNGPFDETLVPTISDIEWGLRAMKNNIACYFVETARFTLEYVKDSQRIGEDTNELESILQLSQAHNIPSPLDPLTRTLISRFIWNEINRVKFSADYGRPISAFTRIRWYASNLIKALKRPHLKATIQHTRSFSKKLGRSR